MQRERRSRDRQDRNRRGKEEWSGKRRNRKWKRVRQAGGKGAAAHGKRADVTVVIPNFEGEKYIGPCLESLFSGSMAPEVIVVDNGSRDGSVAWMERWMERRRRKGLAVCRLVRFPENRGFCAAVNEGIRLAQTEYVILLNNDTQADRDFVKNLYQAIRKRKDAFSVGAKILSFGDKETIDDAGDLYCALGWAFALGKGKKRTRYGREARIFAACACAAIYRKDVFDTIGYFDENHFAYLEDIDVGYRARIFGYENYYTPDAIVYHVGSAVTGSRHNAFKVRLTARNGIYLVYKNMPPLQAFLNLPWLAAGIGIKALFFLKKGLGKAYVKGLADGFRLCLSLPGREKRIPFHKESFGSYVRIQLELWLNMLRRITG